jgi:hypothetical protein
MSQETSGRAIMIKSIQRLIRSRQCVLAMLMILIGAGLRLVLLGQSPPGLNQDEASAGYEAWALLHYGIDRNGSALPVLFISWGSGQNVLYSYLSIPFIALFGLNEWSVRLLSALAGIASLPVFYLLAKKLRDGRFALLALLTLAFNPWHIMLSRWALESNLLPFFLLLGIYLLVLAGERPRLLPVSAAVFALSLYSYGTAFLFLPTFLILSLFALRKRGALRLRPFLLSAAVFILIALPITLCNAINMLHLREIRFLGMTLPILTETRQAATTVLGGGGISSAAGNFLSFLKLLWTQSDGLPWNAAQDFGLFFGLPGLLIAAYGLAYSLVSLKKCAMPFPECFVLFALLTSVIASFLIDININRINMAFLPILYFQALGLHELSRLLGRRSVYAFAAALSLLLVLFVYHYCTAVHDTLSDCFFEGFGDALRCAQEMDKETVWVTDRVNAPYIFVLFYNKISPEDFQETVSYANPNAAFRQVTGFGKYRFGGQKPERNAVLILHQSEPDGYEVLAGFGSYAVAALP